MKLANRTAATFLTLLGGILSSLVVAIILGVIAAKLKLAVYAFSAWGVLPVGSVIAGFASGIGYIVAFRMFSYRPYRLVLIPVIAVSVCTYLAVYFADYYFSRVRGQPISGVVSFGKFMDLTVRHREGDVSGLGVLGFGISFVRDLLGFGIGSFVVFYPIFNVAFCPSCERRLRTIKASRGYARTLSSLKVAYEPALDLLNCANWGGAAYRVDALGRKTKDSVFRLLLQLEQCTDCKSLYDDLSVKRITPPKDMDAYHVRKLHPELRD
jgi:hypothetical protein